MLSFPQVCKTSLLFCRTKHDSKTEHVRFYGVVKTEHQTEQMRLTFSIFMLLTWYDSLLNYAKICCSYNHICVDLWPTPEVGFLLPWRRFVI